MVRAKSMLDVEKGDIISAPAILIRNDKIVEVTSGDSKAFPKDASIIDLGNTYLLPGLIDAHVHLAWAGQPYAEDARKTLLAGFTTVRNPGSTGGTDIQLRKEIESGKILGPRILISGPGLGSKGGICDQVFSGEGVVQNAADAKKIVKSLASQKVDFIKICAGGMVVPTKQDESATEMTDEVLQAIVNEANAHGLVVASHAQGPAAILQAVRAKVRSIEHGGMINEEAAEAMKKNQVYLVPTLFRLNWILENAKQNNSAPAIIERLATSRTQVYENMRKAIALGVPIAFGTDAVVYPHGLNAREFSVLVELGMSPLQAIQTATIHASRLIDLQDQVGQIRPGYFADLIAVNENPLQNIQTLEDVSFVMKSGAIVRKKD